MMYHNGCSQQEQAWDKIKSQFPNVRCYKVNTMNSEDIKQKGYADGNSKPYWKFYLHGELQEGEVKYKKWEEQEPELMEKLEMHSNGQSPYNVTQLEDIAQFDEAVQKAGKNVMAVCYHNGCPTPERAWDRME